MEYYLAVLTTTRGIFILYRMLLNYYTGGIDVFWDVASLLYGRYWCYLRCFFTTTRKIISLYSNTMLLQEKYISYTMPLATNVKKQRSNIIISDIIIRNSHNYYYHLNNSIAPSIQYQIFILGLGVEYRNWWFMFWIK